MCVLGPSEALRDPACAHSFATASTHAENGTAPTCGQVSRNRFWGTPLPIWTSDDGEEIVVVGSVEACACSHSRHARARMCTDAIGLSPSLTLHSRQAPRHDIPHGVVSASGRIDGAQELFELSGVRVTDLHREHVDQITIPSRQGKGVLKCRPLPPHRAPGRPPESSPEHRQSTREY
jgi:hypothetical protein